MGPFYKGLLKSAGNSRFYKNFLLARRSVLNFWYLHHNKILKHAVFGGKQHAFERGHVAWNRKGRW